MRLEATFANYQQAVARIIQAGQPHDFAQVIADMDIPHSAVLAIIELGDPLLAYYLGQHAELCEKLRSLNEVGQILEVGRIAGKLQQ